MTEQPGDLLCGRDMISALNIGRGPYYSGGVCNVQETDIEKMIRNILEENKELSDRKLGRCITIKVPPKFKEGKIVPKFFRARPVPYTMKPTAEKKLAQMVSEGVLKPTECSDWAAPTVIVPKPGEQARICGNFKVTENPILDINQYPLPKPEELFYRLNGGKVFQIRFTGCKLAARIRGRSRKV